MSILLSSKKKKNNGNKNGIIKPLQIKIPKTVQDTIPYEAVYKNGIIEIEPGVYTKSFPLEDINFRDETVDMQESLFSMYEDLLNSFGSDVDAEITIYNRNINKEQFRENILLKYKGDGNDELREEYNNMLLDKINTGQCGLVREKYLTVSIKADDVEKAANMFARLEPEIQRNIKRINKTESVSHTLVERLDILHSIYHPGSDIPFYKTKEVDGRKVESFNLDHIRKMGITTKDLIGPSCIEFYSDYFKLDDKYGRAVFIDNIPSYLTTDFLTDLTDNPCNMVTSVHYESIPTNKAVKIIKTQMVNINSNVVDAQKKANRSGYSPELISSELKNAQEEASKLLNDMQSRNQKLFFVSIVLTFFANDLEQLNENMVNITSTAGKYLCSVKKLKYQQEYGFACSLPLCNNKLYIKRLLTTESAAIFIPFSTQEAIQKGGMYYGLNASSKNMILLSRIHARNGNGVILGTPGAGKSFTAKREMVNVFLATDDDIFVIDPEREYAALAKLLGGEIIRIAAGSKVYINPFDMDLNYADQDDPVALKSDNICSLCETILGGHYGLNPIQISVIDRCVRQLYKRYLEHMAVYYKETGETFDRDATPTLRDFYNLLRSQVEPEAQSIALALEIYVEGLDTFAHKTNVDTKARFTVYDIKDIGSGMKEMGLQICLNDIWNKMISNKKKGKRTWFYIDEFYLLTQTDSSAKFLQQIWKRARKWGGIPTGITQNVEDMLASKEARTIISNSDFVLMLNQAPIDRAELAEMFNISPSQLTYITNSEAGHGLIYTGKTIIPFIDRFPTDTKLYKVMTTKFDETTSA